MTYETAPMPEITEEGRKKLLELSKKKPNSKELQDMIIMTLAAVKTGKDLSFTHRQAAILGFLFERHGYFYTEHTETSEVQ